MRYISGVYNEPKCFNKAEQLDHGVSLTGYGHQLDPAADVTLIKCKLLIMTTPLSCSKVDGEGSGEELRKNQGEKRRKKIEVMNRAKRSRNNWGDRATEEWDKYHKPMQDNVYLIVLYSKVFSFWDFPENRKKFWKCFRNIVSQQNIFIASPWFFVFPLRLF